MPQANIKQPKEHDSPDESDIDDNGRFKNPEQVAREALPGFILCLGLAASIVGALYFLGYIRNIVSTETLQTHEHTQSAFAALAKQFQPSSITNAAHRALSSCSSLTPIEPSSICPTQGSLSSIIEAVSSVPECNQHLSTLTAFVSSQGGRPPAVPLVNFLGFIATLGAVTFAWAAYCDYKDAQQDIKDIAKEARYPSRT